MQKVFRLLATLKLGYLYMFVLAILPFLVLWKVKAFYNFLNGLYYNLNSFEIFFGALCSFLLAGGVVLSLALLVDGRFAVDKKFREETIFKFRKRPRTDSTDLPTWADHFFGLPLSWHNLVVFFVLWLPFTVVAVLKTFRPLEALFVSGLAFVVGTLFVFTIYWVTLQVAKSRRLAKAFFWLIPDYLMNKQGELVKPHLFAFVALGFVLLTLVVLRFLPMSLGTFDVPTIAYLFTFLIGLIYVFGFLEFHVPIRVGTSAVGLLVLLMIVAWTVNSFTRDGSLLYTFPVSLQNPDVHPLTPLEVVAGDDTIVLVGIMGGGITAASWSTFVLDTLYKEIPTLRDHVRLFSSVSGGSVGVANYLYCWQAQKLAAEGTVEPCSDAYKKNQTYLQTLDSKSEFEAALAEALAKDGNLLDAGGVEKQLGTLYSPNGDVNRAVSLDSVGDDTMERAHMNARKSSLSSVSFALGYVDFLNFVTANQLSRLFTLGRDRGSALQTRWEHNAQAGLTHPLPSPMLSDFNESIRHKELPAFIMNTTSLETGERVMITPLSFTSFRNTSTCTLIGRAKTFSEYVAGESQKLDLDIWTAARLSATFPFVSPAARARLTNEQPIKTERRNDTCESDKDVTTRLPYAHHFLDGGYHDNYGMMSILDFLTQILETEHFRYKPGSLTAAGDPNAVTLKNVIILEMRLTNFEATDPQATGAQPWLAETVGPVSGAINVAFNGSRKRNDIALSQFIDGWEKAFDGEIKFHIIPIYPNIGTKEGTEKIPGPLSWHLTRSDECALFAGFFTDAQIRQADTAVNVPGSSDRSDNELGHCTSNDLASVIDFDKIIKEINAALH
jgi:Patatin-like phospholipase